MRCGRASGAAWPRWSRIRSLAPLATSTGAPYVLVDRFALALYPMLEARVGAEVRLSPAQWRQLGAVVRQVHAVPVTPQHAS